MTLLICVAWADLILTWLYVHIPHMIIVAALAVTILLNLRWNPR